MGIFDKIKSGAGLNYLEQENPQKPSPPRKDKKIDKSVVKQDRQLKKMEYNVQKAIRILQEVQEKLRVRRGI